MEKVRVCWRLINSGMPNVVDRIGNDNTFSSNFPISTLMERPV